MLLFLYTNFYIFFSSSYSAHFHKTKWKSNAMKHLLLLIEYTARERERMRERGEKDAIIDNRWQVFDERRHYKWGFFYCHHRLSFSLSLTGIKCIWSKKIARAGEREKERRLKLKSYNIKTYTHIGRSEERKNENPKCISNAELRKQNQLREQKEVKVWTCALRDLLGKRKSISFTSCSQDIYLPIELERKTCDWATIFFVFFLKRTMLTWKI